MLQNTILQFLNFIQHEKRYANNTYVAYQNDLQQFTVFIQHQFGIDIQPQNVKSSFIRTWLASLKQDEKLSKTINRKISTLRSYFKFLLKLKLISANPVSGIVALKMPKRLVNYVAEKDMQALFEQQNSHTDDTPKSYKNYLDALILEMFYATGIRVSELTQMDDANVDISNKQIKIVGKGNKERLLPLHQNFIEKIIEYKKIKEKLEHSNATKFFFIQENGKALYVKYVYLLVTKMIAQVSTIQKKSPHVLRHTFATHLLQHGAELNAVKTLLGHASLAATQVYTHHSIDKLKEIHKKAHPKG